MQPEELRVSRNPRIWDINPIFVSRPIVKALVWVSADGCLMADRNPRSFSPSFLDVKLASCSAVHPPHIGTSYRTSRQVHQNIGSEDVVLGVVNWTLETGPEVCNRLNRSLVTARGKETTIAHNTL